MILRDIGAAVLRHAPFHGASEDNDNMSMSVKVDRWTIAQLHRLPEDGNKYELVHGELFVTPAPTNAHETILAILASLLEPYVRRHKLGRIYHPRAIVRRRPRSEVEPDLFVRPFTPPRVSWDEAPRPILVVEVTSESTRRRDYLQKREFYTELRIPHYWIIDVEDRNVCVVRPGSDDVIVTDKLRWQPVGPSRPLVIDLRGLFREALG